ncbi:MAG: hypothetical protein IJ529_06320 [Alphaproteobacteria bacterium]|nr:hypothetical protein [Alphaproteobacteria bacterium]MBQ9236228.1 hypothetical protein [Alphaproteobacteria bacterium]
MCKAALVLSTIKKTKGRGGLTPLQLQLEEALTEDLMAMKQEIKELKEDVSELKADMSSMNGKLDLLIAQAEHKPLLQIIKELKDCKGFWVAVALLIIGAFGMNIEGLKSLF